MQASEDPVPVAAGIPLDVTAAGADGGARAPVIVSTAPGIVLTPPGLFFHKACLAKVVMLTVSLGLLGYSGHKLVESGNAPLANWVMSFGPPIIILGYFMQRYNLSHTKRQTAYTFMEAILWMIPLMTIVAVVDPIIKSGTTAHTEFSCTYDVDFGSQFLFTIGSIVQCGPLNPNRMWTCNGDEWALGAKMGSGGSLPSAVFKALDKGHCHRLAEEAGFTDRMAIKAVEQGTSRYSILQMAELDVDSVAESLARALRSHGGEVTVKFEYTYQTVLGTLLFTYFRAAFLEESLKYIAVRRIVFKDYVADCGALIVYALAAAAGFAAYENLGYAEEHGITVMYVRMVMTVPLHCTTGLIIGIHIGYRKFLGRNFRYLHALGVPVLVHGTFNFALMRGYGFGAIVCLVLGAVYCRRSWLQMDNVCVVDVSELQRQGMLSEPVCCCCACDCLTALCDAQDPALQQERVLAARVQQVARQSVANIFPPVPSCQTMEITCRACQQRIRCNILYPSFCPHCGASAEMP